MTAVLYVHPERDEDDAEPHTYHWFVDGDLPYVTEDGEESTRRDCVSGFAATEEEARAAGEAKAAELGVELVDPPEG